MIDTYHARLRNYTASCNLVPRGALRTNIPHSVVTDKIVLVSYRSHYSYQFASE